MNMENMYGKRIRVHTLVVGSGAAGYNAADRLYQYGETDVALVTENRMSGTSRNTGSDKQTYYKLSLSGGQDDSVEKLAGILYSGGCMDGDHALCEAALSAQGFFKLVELGVPFPNNSCGEYVGYKTDHDPNHRGTSVGPYTSRYMTEVLEQAVEKKGIPIYDRHQVIRILVHEGAVYGVLCLDTKAGEFVLMECTNLVWATGGPAGIYQDSVYPSSQFGASGLAFEAGAKGKNLTEWQYGLASLKPRWNVSGSYMQVLPRFVSTDLSGGDEREFLMEYFGSREQMMDMVFLKGYQWPFDVRKVKDGSSVIDLLVYRETCQRGRRVWLDYRNNPGDEPVDYQMLAEETRSYLQQAGACQDTPFERLCQLNELAVSFYREHGVDLEHDMLEVAVCAQHNNGGLDVDAWWQTCVKGLFAAGEAAGTHGIYRPGGSALNSGQAGSTRAAEYIASHGDEAREWTEEAERDLMAQAEECIRMGKAAGKSICAGRSGNQEDGLVSCEETLAGSFAERWKTASGSMSRCGAMVRDVKEIEKYLKTVEEELESMTAAGMEVTGAEATGKKSFEAKVAGKESVEADGACGAAGMREADKAQESAALSRFFRYRDMLLCQKVYLSAMMDYVNHEGKSRGSAVYLTQEDSGSAHQRAASDSGKNEGNAPDVVLPGFLSFSLDGEDGLKHASEVQEIRYDRSDGTCCSCWRPVRPIPERNQVFEVVWKEYRNKWKRS